jgi:hypothetical protein
MGRISILFIIVAPVVVNPETVSKYASTSEGMLPEKTKGRDPKKETRIHPNETIVKPSLALIFFFFVGNFDIAKPVIDINNMQIRNDFMSD